MFYFEYFSFGKKQVRVLEESLVLSRYWTNMIPGCVLSACRLPADQFLSRFSWRKFLCVAEGGHNRNPQLTMGCPVHINTAAAQPQMLGLRDIAEVGHTERV